VTVGTLVLYRREAGAPTPDALADATAFADAAGAVLLEHSGGADGVGALVDPGQAVVLQAAGMVAVQLGVGLDEAGRRIGSYAGAHGTSVGDVARAVVTRSLRIGPAPAP
jgi:hypothetical protein